MKQLPNLSQLTFPAYRSLLKGVKIGNDDIFLEDRYEGVFINEEQRVAYRDLFEFSEELPLTLLYPLAQRAHLDLMLDKRFTIGVPGMVHLSNSLWLTAPVDHAKPFDLEASVHVETKKEGSLLPLLKLDYYQDGRQVAYCESRYLARRKSKVKSTRKEAEPFTISNIEHREHWSLIPAIAKEYATISGDSNPIHTSRLAARLVGFKKRIIHGWYNASRITAAAEKLKGKPSRRLDIRFLKPVFLPSELDLKIGGGEECHFLLENEKHRLVEGELLF